MILQKSGKIIARGAEAIILRDKSLSNTLIKKRIAKGYRHPALDEKLRKLRTRQESRLLEKASNIIPIPRLIKTDEISKTLIIEEIKGKKLANHLEKIKNYQLICRQIGKSLAKLHDNSIIHGDLTTSNLILGKKDSKVYFIDFGLGFHSIKNEDKAVDLHVLKEALQAKHPSIYKKAFTSIISGYRSSQNSTQVLKQLEKVEKRGRYKAQY